MDAADERLPSSVRIRTETESRQRRSISRTFKLYGSAYESKNKAVIRLRQAKETSEQVLAIIDTGIFSECDGLAKTAFVVSEFSSAMLTKYDAAYSRLRDGKLAFVESKELESNRTADDRSGDRNELENENRGKRDRDDDDEDDYASEGAEEQLRYLEEPIRELLDSYRSFSVRPSSTTTGPRVRDASVSCASSDTLRDIAPGYVELFSNVRIGDPNDETKKGTVEDEHPSDTLFREFAFVTDRLISDPMNDILSVEETQLEPPGKRPARRPPHALRASPSSATSTTSTTSTASASAASDRTDGESHRRSLDKREAIGKGDNIVRFLASIKATVVTAGTGNATMLGAGCSLPMGSHFARALESAMFRPPGAYERKPSRRRQTPNDRNRSNRRNDGTTAVKAAIELRSMGAIGEGGVSERSEDDDDPAPLGDARSRLCGRSCSEGAIDWCKEIIHDLAGFIASLIEDLGTHFACEGGGEGEEKGGGGGGGGGGRDLLYQRI